MSKKISAITILEDFYVARKAKSKLIEQQKEDHEFYLGKQWKDEDKETLITNKIQPRTINKIQTYIWLVSGMERQNRSDPVAYPEGDEDGVVASIVTRLLKNISKRTEGPFKMSELFDDGIISGEGYIEPYIDYTYDMISGDPKLKKSNSFLVFPDPGFLEYDMSDANYIIKLQTGISEEELIQMFPEKEKKIKRIVEGRIYFQISGSEKEYVGKSMYDHPESTTPWVVDVNIGEKKSYDLITYYYKNYVKKHVVIDRYLGQSHEAKDKETAERYKSVYEARREEAGVVTEDEIIIIERMIPEIWEAFLVGNNDVIEDKVCWSYPKYKGYPIIPFYARRTTTPVDDKELMVQGIVRPLKDPQMGYNKRKTSELKHLNASINSGKIVPKDAFSPEEEEKIKKFGNSPGYFGKYDPGKTGGTVPNQWIIGPGQLSSAYSHLAAEDNQDMKESSGINADQLAISDKTLSGKAILLRVKQGLVMVQGLFDNWERTEKLLYKFQLTQLGEYYTVEGAIRVLGDSFIKSLFTEAVMDEAGEPMLDKMGETKTEVNKEKVKSVINQILNDASMGKFDVSIGLGTHTESTKYMNYTMMMELMQTMPGAIPPDIIIKESMLSEDSKQKIIESIRRLQEAQAVNQGGPVT